MLANKAKVFCLGSERVFLTEIGITQYPAFVYELLQHTCALKPFTPFMVI